MANPDGIWGFGTRQFPHPPTFWVANRQTPAKNLSAAAAVITAEGKLAVMASGRRNFVADGECGGGGGGEAVGGGEPGAARRRRRGRVAELRFSCGYVASGDEPLREPVTDVLAELHRSGAGKVLSPAEATGVRRDRARVQRISAVLVHREVDRRCVFRCARDDGAVHLPVPFLQSVHAGGGFRVHGVGGRGWRPASTYEVPSRLFRPAPAVHVVAAGGELEHVLVTAGESMQSVRTLCQLTAAEWGAGDFSGGCRHRGGGVCGSNDGFEEIGAVSFDGSITDKGRIRREKEEEDAVFPVTNLKVFSYKELNTATRGFSEKLGHGGFGVVFRGELGDSSPVAVKRLERPGALVYDYMPNGPLSLYLKRDGKDLNWDGLATMRGTWGYVAPEWISGVAITAKADVYSYGMTLLELIGGRRNVEGPPSAGGGGAEEKWFFPPWAARQIIEGNVAAVVDERLAGGYDTVEAERVGLVAVWCIQDEEAMRPTMGMVVRMLEGMVEVGVPPPPKLLQAFCFR
ncbi:receptor-like protein kinase 4 [Actinidia rufa]|uniref:Receptor-like protein kinase 4 n=1 Tax=Actinidia rufa TaxID=165716 RepID=A0A7J0HDG3_9ERIC|nr:receptor-like protein kinase 4 [Actinidia rufa]